MVKTKSVSYTDALMKIITELVLKKVSKDIVSMRKTSAGHLLVELGRSSSDAVG